MESVEQGAYIILVLYMPLGLNEGTSASLSFTPVLKLLYSTCGYRTYIYLVQPSLPVAGPDHDGCTEPVATAVLLLFCACTQVF